MSQTKGIETEIDGGKYVMYMLAPMQSHDLLVDVTKMIGPSLGPVIDRVLSGKKAGATDDPLEQEIPADFFTQAMTSFFGGLDKAVLRDVVAAFKTVTHVDGVQLDRTFDVHFLGRLDVMYKWVAWGMSVQWGKSFAALISGAKDQGDRVKAMMGSQSPSI